MQRIADMAENIEENEAENKVMREKINK